jgi:transcriptional regulator of heat shock response
MYIEISTRHARVLIQENMLDTRKNQLFLALVREHITSGTPVGSKALVEHARLDKSPATIRNEMAELEDSGLITQPHTSAGRIPTEKGWKYYIENFLKAELPSARHQEALEKIMKQCKDDYAHAVKTVAKTLAEFSKNACIVGFSKDDVYYTGLSNLFSEPEFENVDLIQHMSHVIDHLDEVMNDIFSNVESGTHVLVGRDNPFGTECGVVLNKYKRGSTEHIIGILGPSRMAYNENYGLMQFTHTLLIA